MGTRGFSTHHPHRVSLELSSKASVQLRKLCDSDLFIRPRTAIARLDLIREFAEGVGVDPEWVQIESEQKKELVIQAYDA